MNISLYTQYFPYEYFLVEKDAANDVDVDEDIDPSKRRKIDEEYDDSKEMSTPKLYKRLQEVDPDRAEEIHPNERRKILRSLEGKNSAMMVLKL